MKPFTKLLLFRSLKLGASMFGLLAAGFWMWSAIIKVPNDQDALIAALQRISELSATGAFFASMAAIAGVISFWFERPMDWQGELPP
jgi:hypothetical protein